MGPDVEFIDGRYAGTSNNPTVPGRYVVRHFCRNGLSIPYTAVWNGSEWVNRLQGSIAVWQRITI